MKFFEHVNEPCSVKVGQNASAKNLDSGQSAQFTQFAQSKLNRNFLLWAKLSAGLEVILANDSAVCMTESIS